MKILLTFCLIIAGSDAVTTVTGYRGRSVQIKCPYGSGYEEYKKYLCRGKCPRVGYNDVPVRSGSPAKDTRFSLYDDTTAKVFTVTITDLRTEDGSTYWCVIEQTGFDIYTEVLLLVKTDDPANSTVSHSTHSAPTHSMSPSVHAEITHSTAGTPLNNANHTISAGSSQEFPTSTVIVAVSVIPVLLLMALLIAVAVQRKKKTQALSPAQSLQSSSTSHLVLPPDRRSLSNTLYSTAELPTISPELSQTIYTGLGAVNPVYATVHRRSDAPVQDSSVTHNSP
ncbi:CMRF35-like molecule 1 [Ictalurus punctatus]|uniref:CMRF35-like molecule 1 n=1 Tax=Ictalurus punctatus TaxID=7998 RepID=A0A2D0Q670_ICTPU|nr:CMRF35-like molecule 1 [Ictalurus punctatus]